MPVRRFRASHLGVQVGAPICFEDVSLLLLGLAFGAVALPVYSLCLAHTNDFAAAEDFVEVSSELLLLFGTGAAVGPLVASAVMGALGPSGVFLFTAPVHACLAGFAVWRITRRARPAAEERTVFQEVPPTSPAVLRLDPRAPTESSASASPGT